MKLLYFLIILFFFCSPFTAQNFTLQDSVIHENDVWVTHDIVFDFDKPSLRPESYAVLDSLYEFLSNNPKIQIEITNHCDERFSPKYSNCITCRRAKTMEEYLINKGISQERLIAKGMNDITPLIVNAQSDEEHAQNRRTEVRITKTE